MLFLGITTPADKGLAMWVCKAVSVGVLASSLLCAGSVLQLSATVASISAAGGQSRCCGYRA